MSAFIVQESIHADSVSRHETREEAVAAIEEMLRAGLAEPGEFNIREIDDDGETVRVFGLPDTAAPARTACPCSSQWLMLPRKSSGTPRSFAWFRLRFGSKSRSLGDSCSRSRYSVNPSAGTGTAIVAPSGSS